MGNVFLTVLKDSQEHAYMQAMQMPMQNHLAEIMLTNCRRLISSWRPHSNNGNVRRRVQSWLLSNWLELNLICSIGTLPHVSPSRDKVIKLLSGAKVLYISVFNLTCKLSGVA